MLRHGSKKAWDSNLSATSVRPKIDTQMSLQFLKFQAAAKKLGIQISAISVEGVRPKKRHPNVIAVSKIPSKNPNPPDGVQVGWWR